MKFVKLAVLVAILSAIIIGAWMLMFPPARHIEVRPQEAPLYADAGRDVWTAIRSFRHGWSDRRFAEARNSLARHSAGLDAGSADALADTLANGILFKLDSIIRNEYRGGYPQRAVSAVPAVADNYRGLDTLVRYYPNLAHSAAYRRLIADRRAIDGAVAFGGSTFVLPAQVTISMVRTGAGYSLDWNLALRNYSTYRAQQEQRRQRLLADYGECSDLTEITWIPRVLSRQAFTEKIAAGERAYLASERRVLINFLNALPRDSRLSDAAARSAMANADLVALESNIEPPLAGAELSAAIHSAASMLRTIQ